MPGTVHRLKGIVTAAALAAAMTAAVVASARLVSTAAESDRKVRFETSASVRGRWCNLLASPSWALD